MSTQIINKTIIDKGSVTLPELKPSTLPGVHRKAHHQALVILAMVAALPATFQLGKDELRSRTELSARDLQRGMRYLKEHGYAKLAATTGLDGRMAGQAWCFSFSGNAKEFPNTVKHWTAEGIDSVSATKTKAFSPKSSVTASLALGDVSPVTPYNVASEVGSLTPQPPAEAGGSVPDSSGVEFSLPEEVAEIVEASLASLPAEVHQPSVKAAIARQLQELPELIQNIVEDQDIFPDEETKETFVQAHRLYGFCNPFSEHPDLALGRQGALLAFLRGDVTKFEFRRWMATPRPSYSPQQAFYEPVEKLAKLPRLRQAGAMEFMQDTLCGLILQDTVAGELPYAEIRSILRGLRRGYLRPQQILRAWLHTRLYHRVEPLQLSPLLASCAVANEDAAYALRDGVAKWTRQKSANVIELQDQVRRHLCGVTSVEETAEKLRTLSRQQAAMAWLLSLAPAGEEDETLVSQLRAGFKLVGADPSFMALEMLQFDFVFHAAMMAEAPVVNGVADHPIHVTNAVYRARRWVVDLNRMLPQLLAEDIRTQETRGLLPHRVYAL